MGKEDLTGLFAEGKEPSTDSGSESSIPESFKKLGRNSGVDLREEPVHTSLGVNMFYPENSSELETGRGRDELVEEVFRHANGDYDITEWSDYDPADVTDLAVYLLDELDSDGEMRGKDLVNYLDNFVREDGEPEFLQDYEF